MFMNSRHPSAAYFVSSFLVVLALASLVAAADPPEIRVGSELDFQPYAFTDKDGQATGFSTDLIKAVANAMGMRLRITTGPWDKVWNGLIVGECDVLPTVARTPGREPLVDFSLPHTETFDAFFVRDGQPSLPNLAAAGGKAIVVLRSDAAHHQLEERHFNGKVIPVESIPEGLRLVAAGQHDAFLCSKVIGLLEQKQHGIKGLTAGPPIPEYKRVFCFAVRKGNTELLEKLNQGLLIVKTNGEYDRIYQRWLAVHDPWQKLPQYLQLAVAGLVVLSVLVAVLQWLVRRRTRQLLLANKKIEDEVVERRKAQAALEELNATLERRVAERTAALRESEAEICRQKDLLAVTLASIGDAVIVTDTQGRVTFLNGEAERLTGWNLSEAAGQPLATVFHIVNEQTRQPVESPVDKVLRVGGVVGLANHTVLLAKDGRETPIDDSGAPIRAEDESVHGVVLVFRDITERKRAEEAMREGEARLRRIAQAARVGFFEWNATKDVAYWSPEHYELFGYEPGTPITWEGWLRGVHPEDRQRVVQNAQRLMERGRAEGAVRGHADEYRFVRADGAVVWLESDTSLTTVGEEMIVRGSVRDITARKQAEAMIAQNVRLLNATGEIAKVGGWELDLATQELLWTDEVCRIHGVEPGYRPRLDEAIEFYAPESRPAIAAAVQRCMADGEPWDLECRFIPRGRLEPIWVRAQGRGIFGNGKVLKLTGAFQDITQRKQADAALAAAYHQFQSIINNTPDLVYALDLEERFLMANNALAELLHATPEQMLGKRRHEFMPQADAEAHEANDRQVIEAGRVLEFEESSQLQGRSITWLTKKFPLRDAEGRIYAVAGITADISTRKQAEAELKAAKVSAEQAKAVAESASKAKDQFIAVLSHELRTPLTPALAAVSVLADDARLPSEAREDLAMVRRNIDLEVRLIADLLDVSRIISGKLHLEQRPMDVAAAIREAAQIVSGDLDAKGQTLTIETPETPYLTFGDAARLQQVFWNLLRNAVKFTPHRGRIAVRASVVPVDRCPLAAKPCPVGMGDCPLPQAADGNGEPCGGNLIIELSDNGNGIDPEVLSRLFVPFEQGSDGRSFGGLGLGLSICKAVAEMHGGTIAAHSDGPGKGAIFTVRLPIAQCPLAAAHEGLPTALDEGHTRNGNREPVSTEQPQAIRILLVEDHADTAKLMSRLLMADGHEVTIADSVAAALAAVDQAAGKLDLLLSDVGLPDGTGHDLMRQVRQRGHTIPGIALSGYGTPADIEKSKAAGFSEHLTKPLSPDLVAAAIQRLLSYQKLVYRGG